MRFLLALVIIGCISPLHSQNVPVIDTTKNIILLKEKSFGGIFHTQGWGIKFSKGYNKTAFNKRMFVFEMVEMKSLKQIRTIHSTYTNAKSYIYGKLNSVFIFRGTYGIHKQLNRKPYWGGIELRFFYMGGASIGVGKPVFLYILTSDNLSINKEKYNPVNHNTSNIFGRAPFTEGFNELEVYPGIHGKIGLDFDYGVYRSKVNSIEIGALLDVFYRPIQIMAFNNPNYFFLTLYLNLNFGKRYN